jgi:predicted transcriptional regulator
MKALPWTFLTFHGHVLLYLSRHRRATCREIAQEVGVTERAIQKVIHDLVKEEYIIRGKEGRGNVYTINGERPMRHRMEREFAVGELLRALGGEESQKCDGD